MAGNCCVCGCRGEMTALSARHAILTLRFVGVAMGAFKYEIGCSGPGVGTTWKFWTLLQEVCEGVR